MRVHFHEYLPAPIFAYSFKTKMGLELTGTNTMFEKAFLEEVQQGVTMQIIFKQRMLLQGGEYLMSFGVTGYHGDVFEVYHRQYDILPITVISEKNTVGFFDPESSISVQMLKATDQP
jgi:teichoic acid transport system ATP-binding protein